MKKYFRYGLFFALGAMLALGFVACGDESSSGPSKNEETGIETEVSSSSEKDEAISSSSAKDEVSSSSKKVESSSSTKTDVSSSSTKIESSSSSVNVKESSSSSKVESSSGKDDVSSSSQNVQSSSSDKPVESSSSKAKSSSSEISSSSVKPAESSSSESSSSVKLVESSSSEYSSSSVIETSSSSLVATGVCKTDLEDHCTYGSLYDERDGQTYKTVKIGEQWWMAENLRYNDVDPTLLKCQNNKNENCDTYGYLYSRKAALQGCPTGWRLPVGTDFTQLKKFVDENTDKAIGQSLRSQNGGWDNTGIGRGSDSFGMNLLAGGGYDNIYGFFDMSKNALFWQGDSVKTASDCVYYTRVFHDIATDYDGTDFVVGRKQRSVYYNCGSGGNYYVRCIKD